MERAASLAGAWYPGEPRACLDAIERHAEGTSPEPGRWRGLVGPHAGWLYSGDAAGHAYRWLASVHPDPDLVVLFGSHRGPHGPNTVFRGDGWRTPLGTLPTAQPLADRAARDLALRDEPVDPARPDNAVELHLPFVRRFFPRAELLMLGVAASTGALRIGERVGAMVREAGRDAVVVGSTDLTHYGPSYDFEPRGRGAGAEAWVRDENDRGFLDHVLADRPADAVEHATEHGSACCPGAVAAAMEAVRALEGELRPRLLDHYLSSDVRPSSSFVGYAGLLL
jgi:AmmeMemoRadiSam system protein B